MTAADYSDFRSRVRVIRSKRRRRTIGLAVKNGVLEMRIPHLTSRRVLEQIYRKHSKWISNKLALASKSIPLNKRDHLLYKGISYKVIFSDTTRSYVDSTKHTITLPVSSNQASATFRELLRVGMERALPPIISKYAQLMKIKYGTIRVKDVSSYWGSCSAKNNLSFNLRLYQAPREVLEYVVVHELAHIRIRGHSTKFWNYLAKFSPNWKQDKNWLKDHREELEI